MTSQRVWWVSKVSGCMMTTRLTGDALNAVIIDANPGSTSAFTTWYDNPGGSS